MRGILGLPEQNCWKNGQEIKIWKLYANVFGVEMSTMREKERDPWARCFDIK